jgi:OmcA/MtrC family decaheme c-type cytochrome
MAILVGWNTEDYQNTESGSDPALPISINPLFGGATNIGGNVFRVSTTLPAEAGGTGVVGIEGHPAVDGDRIPVANAFEYFAVSGQEAKPRREIVALAKCNECHGNLSLHGNNRQGAIEVCVICHNANATDIEVRPATLDEDDDGVFDDFTATGVDGKREESIHFKYMIHAIHAGAVDDHGFRKDGIVVYGFGRSVHDYSEVRYPGVLSACDACHVDDSFQVNVPDDAAPTTLATTIETAAGSLDGDQEAIEHALADPADDINISTEGTTCYSCHDQSEAIDHMISWGGADVGTEAYLESSVIEDCHWCHAPSEFKDVAKVHWMINP